MRHLALLLALLALPSSVAAEDRTTSGRARFELTFDHGYGFGTEGEFVQVAMDARMHAPFGLGAVLRFGAATQLFSNALALDVGAAYRLDLVPGETGGLQLGLAVGPSLAWGPFDEGDAWALGGWAMLHVDVWHRNFFVGVGVDAHLVEPTDHARQEPASSRDGPVMTVTPLLRVGGDWGL